MDANHSEDLKLIPSMINDNTVPGESGRARTSRIVQLNVGGIYAQESRALKRSRVSDVDFEVSLY
jgi:hypothetical protein